MNNQTNYLHNLKMFSYKKEVIDYKVKYAIKKYKYFECL